MKKEDNPNLKNSTIGFISNFPPKECGIATFTQDLTSSLNKRFNPIMKSKVIAINEKEEFYNYSNKVILQLNKEDIEDYITIAKKINNSKIKLVCIQHEFGLFGGEYGSHLIHFLERVEKPVVVVFHSVLPNPDETRKNIVRSIASRSAAIIVMAEKAIEILNKDYDIEKSKLHLVYHGIPNVPFQSTDYYKKRLKLNNKIVLSTFGLLSRGKGIEYMIKSLPKLVKKYPNLFYLIIGETHPSIRKQEGEKYRKELINLVKELKLENHVKFYNNFITLPELIKHLLATDIYIFTNLEENQIVSGTLSYALGCGKAIVSTPVTYAKEILKDEKGILAEFKNPESYANAIDKILSNKELKTKLEKNAYSFSRQMTWPNVAGKYLKIFNKVVRLREETTKKYPYIKLNHLKKLTDNFGCLQFSNHSIPDKKSGYTLDDNARALIATILHYELFKSKDAFKLIQIYLKFLEKNQEKDGNFQNHFYNEESILNPHSEDAFGRTIWALGYTTYKTSNDEIAKRTKTLLKKSLKKIDELKDLRAKAFSLIGLSYYYKKYKNKNILERVISLAEFLIEKFKEESSENWAWFEDKLTYSNSKLPEALFLAYDITNNKKYLEVAERTLHFLSDIVFVEDKIAPIGQDGWFHKNGKRAFFDQQPVDVSAMVQTYLIAYSITENKHYHERAVLAFNWFLGKNHLNQWVYDETTGGCYDGISEKNVNLNQGAESTISYLIARLFLEEIKKRQII